MRVYDFRSDTVTKPTPVMRRAMAEAEVGDDVYGEDPTINRLEARAAELLGKESALFVTSGTMGNLLAVLASCERGAEVIMGRQGHTFLHEAGGVSVLGGVSMHTVPNQADGSLALKTCKPLCATRRIFMSLSRAWSYWKTRRTPAAARH